MSNVFGVRFCGPLVPYAEGFAGELTRLGFTTCSRRSQLALAAHLSRWLAREGLEVRELGVVLVERFMVARRAVGYTALRTPKALQPLLDYLCGLGVVRPEPARTPQTICERLLAEFGGYLVAERGLEIKAARGYVDLVAPFVAEVCGSAEPAGQTGAGVVGLDGLTAEQVTAFVVGSSRRLAPKTTQRLATALRSLLGFWHVRGVIGNGLAQAVPKVANRRPGLPRPLDAEQVRAMLASCDTGIVDGRRDLAMLTLMSRMGLRAGEVAGLGLEDIDWRVGVVIIRGKRNRLDRLPLPVDVAEPIVAYLKDGRPATALDRSVFIRVKAPHRGLSPTGVTQAVAAAARRAGLGTIYAHRLRHSAATAMLAEGGSLAEIGQVLRHRRPLTTAVYAKVDIEKLRTLARPWPGGVS